MTAPVLSPVRWWRDDATRYVTRGPQIVPAATVANVPGYELLACAVDRAMVQTLDGITQRAIDNFVNVAALALPPL